MYYYDVDGVKTKKAFLFQYCVPAADVAEPDERYVREAYSASPSHVQKNGTQSRIDGHGCL